MDQFVKRLSNVLGVLGIVVCVVAGGARVASFYHVLGAETISVYQGGVGLMVAACLLKLWSRERDVKP